ncbi:hypothetical protein AAFF_G00437120 [Aldrovandia affinis]|uniref:Uncharacterized protein n=1 Tax=Aldrovandia affinis TaxID=143900 RepID=A0AAD7R3G7_9TELE|nr:hypothetical protein AAFF_G00437120 [Aldrovandia affinis]
MPRHLGRVPAHLHAGTEATLVSGRRWNTGAKAGSCEGDAGRMGLRQDSLTPETVAMQVERGKARVRSRISYRNFTAAPARLPRLLARLVRGQQQDDAQIVPGIWRCSARCELHCSCR